MPLEESVNPILAYNSPASQLICVTGDQGMGKTCLLTTVAKEWKVYVADIDGGMEAALNIWQQQGRKREDILVKTVNNLREFHAAVWNPPEGYDLYALDTYTVAMMRIKKHVTATMGVDPQELVDWWKIGGKISAMACDYFDQWREKVATFGAWGLVLCQEKLEGDDPGKIVPDLVGQCRRHVAGICNEVFHLEKQVKVFEGKRQLVRVLRTKDHPSVMAKDRSMALDEFEPADLQQVIKKIEVKRAN